MKKLIVVGPVFFDLIFGNLSSLPKPGQEISTSEFDFSIGGMGIVAVTARKLGLDVSLVSCIGDDLFGKYICDYLVKNGVDTSYLYTQQRTPVSVAVNIGDRAFITFPGCSSHSSELPMALTDVSSHIHGNFHQLKAINIEPFLKETSFSVTLSWEDALNWSKKDFKFLENLDIFIMNQSEAKEITGLQRAEDQLSFLKGYVKEIVIITQGGKGAWASDGKKQIFIPSVSLEIKDTTGAGDSFIAGFLKGYLEHKPLHESLALGNACGALSVSSYGGIHEDLSYEKVLNLSRKILSHYVMGV